MANIKFDKEKCIKCGNCAKDCITYSIEINKDGFPQVSQDGESRCISCQHCFAICPTGAITFNKNKAENADNINYGKPEDILGVIKSRRSVRQFNQTEISSYNLKKIKEMLPYIPTGCNFNGLHFSFIESKTAMDDIRNYVNKKVLNLISNKFTQKYAGKFAKYKTAFEKGEDIIFRNAPHMVVVSSAINAPCANVDPIIALSYIELYAQSLGIGTCWCGFAQSCFKILPKLSKMVDIPDGYKPVYVMLLGNPAVKYHRTIIPEKYPISEVKIIEGVKLNLKQKLKRLFYNFIR